MTIQLEDTATEPVEQPAEAQEPAEQPTEAPTEEVPAEEEPQTFPREYVLKLRDESAKYRQRAAKTDELARRLHTVLVQASGKLQDASDLPFEESHLEDPDALTQAIDALLSSKPHLASRRPAGTIPQGAGMTAPTASLSGLLRRNAGV